MRPSRHGTSQTGGPERERRILATEPRLLLAGQRMLAPAAALLERLDAPLLTVWRSAAEAEDRVRLVAWTRWLEPGAEIGPDDHRPETAELRAAGGDALREVSRRWPPYALPPTIGLVTDGTGLAVSGEHPSGLTRSWLLDQIERRSSASIIVPFADSGVWGLLASDPRGPGWPGHH